MGAPFLRRTVTLKAGGVGKPIPGGFDWFCLDWAASDAFTASPVGIRRVAVQIREKPSDPLTSIGLFGIGDVLRLPWNEMVLSVPSVTGNAATEPTYSLDVLAGRGEFHRDLIARASNESCVTPRTWIPGVYSVAARIGAGSQTLVTAAANISGIRLFPSQWIAHGDGAVNGSIYLSINGTTVYHLHCDPNAGPVAMLIPETDFPPNALIEMTSESAKDRYHVSYQVF